MILILFIEGGIEISIASNGSCRGLAISVSNRPSHPALELLRDGMQVNAWGQVL
jgi:hypothetical protein